ncbi:Not1-domain-containing protein [Crepidotus variabilis]|uniref:General negative regulator of transcription subunit 1 n=1 Tax=Crepidotus variabilis TaxID=179855 RepID=A0A9P6ENU2_9AGAR|nr:Not1-domain-containing protein [Crepidotus variabilis]
MDNPPATNIHTIVKAQIVFLLSTLTEENFERNQLEIRSLSEQHGIDTYLHFIRRLIIHSQPRLSPSPPPSAFDASTSLTFRLLVQETQRLARDPLLADRFRDGVGGAEQDSFRHFDFTRFVDRIGLRPLERFVLAAATVAGQTRKELLNQAVSVIRTEFDNAISEMCHSPPLEHADFTPSQMMKLLANLLTDVSSEAPVLDGSQRQALLNAAQSKLGKESMGPILQRILPKLSVLPNTSLVQVLNSLGPDLTTDPEVILALFERFGVNANNPPRDSQIIEVISNLARLAAEGNMICDVGALVRALVSYDVPLNWPNVIKSFDWPDRHGVDTATLKMLIAILLNTPRTVEPHAVTGFWEIWANPLYQLRLLDALLSLPADTFNFVQLPGHRIVTVDDVSIASPTIKSLAANVQGQTWNSLELFQVLVRLADSDLVEIRNCVREMLDKAIKISAEIVHMGLLQVPESNWNEIRTEYASKLLAMFLAGHPNHQLVFMRIWQIQPEYLKNAFYKFYEDNPLNITRILDVAQDLKILDSLLEVRPFTFALDVAALASRREYLNLDKWLADNVSSYGEEFLLSVIDFLRQKMESEKACRLSDPPIENRTMALNPTTITIALRVLRNNSSLLRRETVEDCVEVRSLCLQIHPRLMSLIPNSDVEPGLTVVTYSNEIESEVDGIYKQMYDEHTPIEDIIAMLQRYKESTSQRDHELFSCMIHFLFDEYKFFQSYYPARELAMTGYLFGCLIRHSLIEFLPLGIAMRYILDALNCPPETNLFKFGTQALSRFEVRLAEWKPLCEALSRIPHLAEARPDLITSIHRALNTPGSTTDNLSDQRHMNSNPPYETIAPFNAIQPDAITEPLEVPPEEFTDRILFIVNNLAPTNFDAKVKEMREQFTDQYSRWFANYLVDQRISTEPNNHPLYLRFLDALDRQKLFKLILQETFQKASALLNSERSVSGSDRNALKNVGTWLGTITLARDHPIKHKNLSFKDLLVEGYDSNRLIVAIPFVCKTIEPCAKSRVFKAPNPWLMAVVSLLAELYHFAELKLNLKFDIEILCKSLEIDLDSVEPATILRTRPLELTGLALPEYTGDIGMLPLEGESVVAPLGDAQVLVLAGQGSAEAHRALGTHIESILSNLVQLVHLNAQLAPLNLNPTFKRAVQLAVDRAVREIILPVVERSVTIAGISTRELVAKDFVTEINEEKIRRAGHLMAQRLAGSLALVTCKEPLKSNLSTHIRQFLLEHGFNEQMIPEAAIALIVQDNLDVACSAIEKAAMERAVNDVDEGFAQSYEMRRRHREQRTTQGFWDPSVPMSNFSTTLPDPLRVKGPGIQTHQMVVYEDFGSDPRRRIDSRPASVSSFHASMPYAQSPSLEDIHAHGLQGHQEAMERFVALTRDLEAVMIQYPTQSLTTLPANHDIRHLVRQIMILADEARDPERTPLMMSQKIVQLLYKTPSPLGREVYVAVLDQLCRSFENVAKEAITWLLYAEDERKFNVPVTVTLLSSGLVNVNLQDQQLAKLLFEDPRPILMTFTVNLIRECLTSEPPVATQGQFVYSLEILNQLAQAGKSNDEVNHLLDDLRGIRRSQVGDPTFGSQAQAKPETDQLREKLFNWFQQWISIFQRSPSPEKSFVPFITQLTKQGILKMEDVSSFFFRVCAESSVNSYIKCMTAGNYDNAFLALDALSRLIVYIIKYHGDASGVNNDQAKVHYLTKILSIFVLVLANLHEEQGPNFQQKPFFRFFSSLVNDLHTIESHLGPVYFQLLIAISDTYSSLQPTYFPGFAFSWMSLISHRLFMPKLLLSENREGWSAFHKLLLSLFKFLHPFLKEADLQPAGRDLYRGALRLLLVLLHDFPEFLSEYYFTLCDTIPQRCIQLRNIVLSAFPPAIILPDPYLRNIKFESIPEMGPIPPILSDFTSGLKSGDLRAYLDQYLLNRGSPSFLPSLRERLKVKNADSSDAYNLSLINSLVMYVGVSSVAQAKARSGSSLFVASDPGVVALQYLAMNLDVEGQHHILSAMMLHLRYPNAHTHWFSSLILYLFVEVNDERFREVVAKVLLERFIVHRPHPWGALVTFIELLRNQKYDFWSKDFVRIAPEVTVLLESVSIC